MKYNNEVIERAIMEALTKRDNGLKIDRDELLRVIMNDSDKDFGIDTVNRKYTKKELQYSIYIHINKKDAYKVYVGQTKQKPKVRWKTRYKKQYLGYSIKSHKWDWEKDFSHIVLCYGLTQEEANALEIALIAIFKSQDKQYGYNIDNGGNSVGQHSAETKRKISKANKGKKLSNETKKKIGEANKGENSYMYGKHLSNEHKRKIGNSIRGEKHYNSKKVYCDGKIFVSVTQCAEFYNVNRKTMHNWLNGTNKMRLDFQELGLRYATIEDINTYPLYIEKQNQQDQ